MAKPNANHNPNANPSSNSKTNTTPIYITRILSVTPHDREAALAAMLKESKEKVASLML